MCKQLGYILFEEDFKRAINTLGGRKKINEVFDQAKLCIISC